MSALEVSVVSRMRRGAVDSFHVRARKQGNFCRGATSLGLPYSHRAIRDSPVFERKDSTRLYSRFLPGFLLPVGVSPCESALRAC